MRHAVHTPLGVWDRSTVVACFSVACLSCSIYQRPVSMYSALQYLQCNMVSIYLSLPTSACLPTSGSIVIRSLNSYKMSLVPASQLPQTRHKSDGFLCLCSVCHGRDARPRGQSRPH